MVRAVRGVVVAGAVLLAACAGPPRGGAPAAALEGGAGPAAPSPALPALRATPAALRLETSGNTWPPPQVVAIEWTGPGARPAVRAEIAYASGSGWLRAAPTGAGTAQALKVQATPADLPPGTYHATLALSAGGEGGSAVAVPVTLTALAASGSRCPPGSTLAWQGGGGGGEPADFGSTFLTRYCAGCHHGARVGAARNGAPVTMNFDTLQGARKAPYTLDLAAAAGPAGTRAFMPPEEPAPSLEERTWLGQWIACGQP